MIQGNQIFVINILKVQKIQSWPVPHRQFIVLGFLYEDFSVELHIHLLLTDTVSRYSLNCKISYLASGLAKQLIIVEICWNIFLLGLLLLGYQTTVWKSRVKIFQKVVSFCEELVVCDPFPGDVLFFIQAVSEVFLFLWYGKCFFWKLQTSCWMPFRNML